MGYRWVDKQHIKPLFAFGHGLSYTSFRISKAVADRKVMGSGDRLTLTVTVENTGSRAGKETVQVYVTDKKSSLPRPQKELKAFQKVSLQPGESRDVVLTLDEQSLSYYDDQARCWVAEPGDFEARIGFSSDRLTEKIGFRYQ